MMDSPDQVEQGPSNRVIDIQPPSEDASKFKFGIIYLSYIPDGLTVKILRDIMSQFGEVGRIYLEPESTNLTSKRKKYTEGWVEFKKKRVAKRVAEELNGTELDHGKKHSILSGQIWSIKYLHKFKWRHLSEKLGMDKGSRDQKRRQEMSDTKKQAEFYQKMTERSRMMKKKRSHGTDRPFADDDERFKTLKSRQNKPTSQGCELAVDVDSDLLSNIFKKTE